MLKWVGSLFLAVALLTATDLQWLVLQSVAWGSMMVRYSEKMPLKVALIHTFDGKHPCCLCRTIAAARKAEKHKEFPLQVRKLEFPPAPKNFVLVAPSDFRLLPAALNVSAESQMQKPLLPPPRSSFV